MSEHTTDGSPVTRVTFSGTPTGPTAPRRAPQPPPESPGLTPSEDPWHAQRAARREQVAQQMQRIDDLNALRLSERRANIESMEAAQALAPHVVPFANMQEVATAMSDPRYKDSLSDTGRQYRAQVLSRVAAMSDASAGIPQTPPPPSRSLSDLHPDLSGEVRGYTTRAELVAAVKAVRQANYLERDVLQRLHEMRISATDYDRLL